MWVGSLGGEASLETEMAFQYACLGNAIEEPDGLEPMGSQRVG